MPARARRGGGPGNRPHPTSQSLVGSTRVVLMETDRERGMGEPPWLPGGAGPDPGRESRLTRSAPRPYSSPIPVTPLETPAGREIRGSPSRVSNDGPRKKGARERQGGGWGRERDGQLTAACFGSSPPGPHTLLYPAPDSFLGALSSAPCAGFWGTSGRARGLFFQPPKHPAHAHWESTHTGSWL